ncbi:MAG: glycosyltransferase, partial [Candidatus Diapherotrites archaeon]
KKSGKFNVLFYGSFRPGQGLEIITKAARLLSKSKEIKFVLAGSGPMLDEVKESVKSLSNVELTGWIAKEKLASVIADADVCLGQFSKLEKIDRVIATKAFECLAMGKPIITGDGTGIRELVENGKDAMLIEKGSEIALVNAILTLKKDSALRENLSKNAIAKYQSEFTDEKIGEDMLKVVESAIGAN